MDDEDFEEFGLELPSAPWHWGYLGIEVLRFGADVVDSLGTRIRNVADRVGGAVNFDIDRREFHEQAALEIETITAIPEE